MQCQRLFAVPTLRNPFWGRVVLTAAISVVLTLYAALRSSGATGPTEVFFGKRGKITSFLDAASSENRLAGRVNGNPWQKMAGDRHGQPGIPKVVYISVADKDTMPSQAQSTVAACTKLNPDYQVQVMGDAERNQTVAEHAPTLLPVYSKLKPTERNDFWSYLVGDRTTSCELHPLGQCNIPCMSDSSTSDCVSIFVDVDVQHSIRRQSCFTRIWQQLLAFAASLKKLCNACADALPVWWMVLRP